MSTQSLQSMLKTIFLAPGTAALEAEKGYRAIWSEWMAGAVARLGITDISTATPSQLELLSEQLTLAPIMKINGHIELGLTMRIASVEGQNVEIKLGTGPISLAGGYFRQVSEESVMSVRANFTMTNTETDLAGYLANYGIKLASPAELTKAVSLLQNAD